MQPKYQVLRPLTPSEYDSLKSSIRESGVTVPVVLDESGNIIDGHHRQRIFDELTAEGVTLPPLPKTIKIGMTEEQKISLAYELNLNRRHYSPEEITELRSRSGKRKSVEESLKQSPQMADRWHAQQTGISDKTIGTVRKEMESGAEIPQVNILTGSDGKSYPRQIDRKPITLHCPDEYALESAKKLVEKATPEIVNAVADGKIKVTHAASIVETATPAQQNEALRRLESGDVQYLSEGVTQQQTEAYYRMTPEQRAASEQRESDTDKQEAREHWYVDRLYKIISAVTAFRLGETQEAVDCWNKHRHDTDSDLVEEMTTCIATLQAIKAAASKTIFLRVVK